MNHPNRRIVREGRENADGAIAPVRRISSNRLNHLLKRPRQNPNRVDRPRLPNANEVLGVRAASAPPADLRTARIGSSASKVSACSRANGRSITAAEWQWLRCARSRAELAKSCSATDCTLENVSGPMANLPVRAQPCRKHESRPKHPSKRLRRRLSRRHRPAPTSERTHSPEPAFPFSVRKDDRPDQAKDT